MIDTPWLTRREAASYLRISLAALDLWTTTGKIIKYRIGDRKAIRYRREELDALLVPAVETPAQSAVVVDANLAGTGLSLSSGASTA